MAMHITVDQGPLPRGFEELEPFTAGWAIADRDQRVEKRLNTPMPELEAFFHAMLSSLNDALGFLSAYPPQGMPEDVNRLFLLTLSLAQIYPCVENFGQQAVTDGWDMRSFRMTEC